MLDEQGRIRWNLDGRITPALPLFTVEGETACAKPYVPRPGMGDPREHVADMDLEGHPARGGLPGARTAVPIGRVGALAAALCRAYNDWLQEHCATAPTRLFGAAAILLQDPDAAVAEVERVARRCRRCAPCSCVPTRRADGCCTIRL